MAPDKRFFSPRGPFSIEELSSLSGAEVVRPGKTSANFKNVAALHDARATDVSFLDNRLYREHLQTTRAGCCIIRVNNLDLVPADTAILASDNPYLAYARIATAFHPDWDETYYPRSDEERVHPSAILGNGTIVGVGAVVGPNAQIGSNCYIAANAYIGSGVSIGKNCRIGPNASIRFSVIGDDVVIYAGARIGEPGFGFAVASDGPLSVPQVGRVIIGDAVEIGANTTIDRGAVPDTVIGSGTRIDNLVQIGHNVEIGQFCVVVAQVGIAGSTKIGDGVQIGGQTAISGHLKVENGARIAACSGVMRNIQAGDTVAGSPAVPMKQFFRQIAALSRLVQKKER
ncbi:MAG: UDP-3-O-acylglucosamine N-acyltransferase [Alphaproteobacteria bacterium MarineAlpha11_Bin1]|nr:MAG: UDP-3-O-acylglucosamine N-acyltransferase [Alphaproteobacteria bacterium MarineAlpha11_Bin1]|tara:strand:- start:1376 stop:2404 length:1029 start_codon:yes stop_codon:yes gene_type:complete